MTLTIGDGDGGDEDSVVEFEMEATDLDGNDLAFEVSGAPRGSTLDITSSEPGKIVAKFRWVPDPEAGDGPEGFIDYVITFTVIELGTDPPLRTSDQARIRVLNRNHLPRLDPIDDVEVDEGEFLSLNLQSADVDGDTITLQAEGLPPGASLVQVDPTSGRDFGPGRARIDWTPAHELASPDAPFIAQVTVSALDPGGNITDGVNRHTFNLTANNVNQLPTLISELENQTLNEEESIGFSVQFQDDDDPQEPIALTLEGDVPAGAELASDGFGRGEFSLTADFDSGRLEGYVINIVATDSLGGKAEASVTVVIGNVNRAAVFGDITFPASVVEEDAVDVQLLASDADNPDESLTFAVVGSFPDGLVQVVDDLLLIRPELDDADTYPLTLSVTDTEGAVAETSFALVIDPLNFAPEFDPLPSFINGVVGEEVRFDVSASDRNDDLLDLKASEVPDGSTFGDVDATLNPTSTFSWTPTLDDVGEHTVTLVITESETNDRFTAVASTTVIVISGEGPIVRNLSVDGNRQTVTVSYLLEAPEGGTVVVTVAYSDNGGGSYSDISSSEKAPGSGSANVDTVSLGLGTDVTAYLFRVTATDDSNRANHADFGPHVIDNSTPRINADNIRAGTGDRVVVRSEVVDNRDVVRMNLSFLGDTQETRHLSGSSFEGQIVLPANPVELLRAAGDLRDISAFGAGVDFSYRLEAFDGVGNSSSAEFTLTIVDDDAPVAVISPQELTVEKGNPATFNARGSSENGRITEYRWDGDASDGFNPSQPDGTEPDFTFSPQRSSVITLQVVDAAGLIGTTTATVTIVDNTPPPAPVFDSIEPAVRSDSTLAHGGTAEPFSTVVITLVGALVPPISTSVDADGRFSYTVDLPDGFYTIGGVSTDSSGNTSVQAATVPIIIDTQTAAIEIDIGAQNVANAIANLRPQIQVTVTDLSGVGIVDLFLLEDGLREVPIGVSRRSGDGLARFTTTIQPSVDLIDGVTYSVGVVAFDLARLRSPSVGRFVESFSVSLSIDDLTPPIVTFETPPADGTLVGGDPLPAIVARLFDGESGPDETTIEINLEGPDGPVALLKPVLDRTDIHVIRATVFPAEDLTGGEYIASAQVRDRNPLVENIGAGVRTWRFVSDPGAPNGSVANRLQTGEDDVEFVATSPFLVVGELNPEEFPGGGTVEFFVNGDLATRTTIDENTGNFAGEVPLVEGLNELVLVSVNAINRRSPPSVARILVLDKLTPQIDALEPSDGVSLNDVTAVRAILSDSTIVSSAVSGIDSASVQVTLDGASIPVDDPNTAEIDGYQYNLLSGQFVYNIPEPFEDLSTHTVAIEVRDKVGNLASAQSTFTVDRGLLDRTPPVISGFSPTDGAILNARDLAREDFSLRAAAYDTESGLERILIRLDGQIVSLGSEDVMGAISFSPEAPLVDGDHLLMIYAEDKAENSTIVNAKFRVKTSTVKPILDPLSAVLAIRRVFIAGEAEPGARITLLINGRPVGTIVADDDGRFSRANVELAEGDSEISVIAEDEVGNTNTSDVLTVTVDVTSPLIGDPSPGPEIRTRDARIPMSVAITDGPSGSGINPDGLTFFLDGIIQVPAEALDFTGGRIAFTPTEDLSEDEHFFRVSTVDNAGNRGTFNSGEFFVDLTPPTIMQIVPADGATVSNAETQITAIVEDSELAGASVELFTADAAANQIAGISEFDAVSGLATFAPDTALPNGDYRAVIAAEDTAGNVNEASVTFTIDTQTVDQNAPLVVLSFPPDGGDVSTTSFLAIRFKVLDTDEIDFETMIIEINGVAYTFDELFGGRSAGRLNRVTGEVSIDVAQFNRQQVGGGPAGVALNPLELGLLENPLELGLLENPLELGLLEDPLELGLLENPLELGLLEDPLELSLLENPLELGLLERPTSLSTGLTTLNIIVGDTSGNFSNFNFNFNVSPTPPTVPQFDLAGIASQAEGINEKDGRIHTRLSEISMVGEIGDLPDDPLAVRGLTVEVLINDNPVDVVSVNSEGVFRLENVPLIPGINRVTGLTRSASLVESSPARLTVIRDETSPTVEFVNLSTHTQNASVSVTTRYSDTVEVGPESVTLAVNNEPIAVDTTRNVVTTEIALNSGENAFVLSAIDAAGNVGEQVRATVIVDSSAPDTAPTDVQAGISFSGTEIILSWEADSNAGAYNLYRAESPITEIGDLTPIGSNLQETQFTDINVNLGVTYHYALTSISPADVEGVRLSENVNVTIVFAPRGGTAVLSDGTRLTASAGGISDDPTVYTALAIEIPSAETLPLVDGAIDGTARDFVATSQSRDQFADQFVLPAAVALPYPPDTAFPEELQVFFLDNETWVQVEENRQVEADLGVITVDASRFGVYQLVGAVPVVVQPSDVNADGIVNIFDLVLVGGQFGQTPPTNPAADVNSDGTVNIFDLVLVASSFGQSTVSPVAPVAYRSDSVQPGVEIQMVAEAQERHPTLDNLVTVQVQVDSAMKLGGIQFDLHFDSKQLTYFGSAKGGLFEAQGVQSYWMTPQVSSGALMLASSAINTPSPSVADDLAPVFAQITFRVQGDVTMAMKSVRLENVQVANLDGRSIRANWQNQVDVKLLENFQNALLQNFPNPFNPETWIPYSTAKGANVIINIYDVVGRLVRTVDVGFVPAGNYVTKEHAAFWDGRNKQGEHVASGVYFYTMEAGSFVATKKLLILK